MDSMPRLAVLLLSSLLLQASQCTPAEPGYRLPKPQTIPRPAPPAWAKATPYDASCPAAAYTRTTRTSPGYKIYHNLWFHNARWYAVLPADQVEDQSLEEGLSASIPLVRMPLTDMRNFTKQLRMVYVHGNSLLIDFPFASYPEHLGHWLELAVPIYNVLRNASWTQDVQGSSRHVNQVLLPGFSKHFIDWVAEVMRMALSPGGPANYAPTHVDYADIDAHDKLGWILFENVMVVQDRYTHPQFKIGFRANEHGDLWRYDGCDRWVSPSFVPSFLTQAYGRGFRRRAYERMGRQLPAAAAPGSAPQLPRRLTLLLPYGEGEPSITNVDALTNALSEVALQFGLEMHSMALSPRNHFSQHLEIIANTAVLVARQSPLLASTAFMVPGSMVLELLPYKWEWHKLSMLYYNMTQSIGDIHHFAWRPTDVSHAVYKEGYAKRYKDWYPGECHAKECLSVQATADLVVDIQAVEDILLAKLPGVMAGSSVAQLAEPWPEAV